jgi:hypothetical protein
LKAPREWRIAYGAEWQASVDQADTGDERFRENRKILEEMIAIGRLGRALVPENPEDRYVTTKDIACGYRMVIFSRVDRANMTCTLEWLILEAL